MYAVLEIQADSIWRDVGYSWTYESYGMIYKIAQINTKGINLMLLSAKPKCIFHDFNKDRE